MDTIKAPPKSTALDTVHTVAKAALSLVPYAGGPAAELFALVISPPLQKRQKQWMEDLAARVEKLEAKKGITAEQLRDSPEFLDAVLAATQAAVRTSSGEKHDALRNAVVNSVLSNAPPPDVQQLYLSIIDALSPWHLRLLYLFKDPVAWFQRKGKRFPNVSAGSLNVLIRHAYPETDSIEIGAVWHDLFARGLVNTQELGVNMTGNGLTSVRTTSLGGHVVDFTLNNLDDEGPGQSR
jgi:hypothetical protein